LFRFRSSARASRHGRFSFKHPLFSGRSRSLFARFLGSIFRFSLSSPKPFCSLAFFLSQPCQ